MGRWATLLLAIAACDAQAGEAVPVDAALDGGDPFACAPRVGDPAAPIELLPIAGGPVDGVALADGATVRLTVPPQGGIILLVGVRARNVDGCMLQLTAALRDTISDQIIGIESRPAQLRVGADGWGIPVESQLFSMANLAVCPATAASRDVFDQPWRLELQVDDRGRTASTAVTIFPECGDDASCRCQCAAGAQPGQCPAI